MLTSPPRSSSPISAASNSQSLLDLLTRLSRTTSSLQSRPSSCRNPSVILPAVSAISKSLLFLHTLLLLPPMNPASSRNRRRAPSLDQEPRPMTTASFATNSSGGISYASDTDPKGELPPHLEIHRELIVELLLELEKQLMAVKLRLETLDGPTLAVKLEKMDIGLKAICEAMTSGAGEWVGDWEMERILGRAMEKEVLDRLLKPRTVRKWTLGKIGEALTVKTDAQVKRKKDTQPEIGPLTPWLLEHGGGERYPGARPKIKSQDGQKPASHQGSMQAQYGGDTWSAVVEKENRRARDEELKNLTDLGANRPSVGSSSQKEPPKNLGYTENNFPFSVPPAETFISSPAIFAPVLPPSGQRLSLQQSSILPHTHLHIPHLKSRSNPFHAHGESSKWPASLPPEYSENSSLSVRSATNTSLYTPASVAQQGTRRRTPPPRPPRPLEPPQATYNLGPRANGPLSDTWLPPDLSPVPSPSKEPSSPHHETVLLNKPPHDQTSTHNPKLLSPHYQTSQTHNIRRNSNPASWKSRLSALILPFPSTSTSAISPPTTFTSAHPTFTELRISLESFDSSSFSRAKKPKRELWTGSIPVPLATGLNTWITEELRQYTQHPADTIYPLRVPTVVAKRIHPLIPHARIAAWTSALSHPDVDLVRVRGLFWALPEDERVVVIYLLSLLRLLVVSCGRPVNTVAGLFAVAFLGDAGRPGSSSSGGSSAPVHGGAKKKTLKWGTGDVVNGFEQVILTAPGLLVRSNNSWGDGEKWELKIRNEIWKWRGARTVVSVDGSEVVNVGRVRHVLGTSAEEGSAWDWRGEIGGRWQGMG